MHLNFSLEGDELDRRMGGGLYVGQVITIEGGSGAGKTLLCLRLAYGMIKHGATIAYVSSQFPVREFMNEAESLGYPLMNEILSDQVSFITSVFLMRKTKKAKLDDLLNLEQIKEKQVLIIDSLNPEMFSDYEIGQYFSRLRKFSENRIVIVTVNPADVSKNGLSTIHELSTTIIGLNTKEVAGERKHMIDLMKFPMAHQSFQQAIPFRIEPGRGLIVEISSVS